MPEEVVILSAGMMCAVGLTTAETAAAVRSGTMRFTPTSALDKTFSPFSAAQVPDEGLPDLLETIDVSGLSYREILMLRLAATPLAEALKPLGRQLDKPALSLALPDTETLIPIERRRFLSNLATQTGQAFQAAASSADYSGRAGGLLSLEHARRQVAEGKARFALAGAVDSYVDLFLLDDFDEQQRIKSAENLDGFIPGEAAAFVLLASRGAADAVRARPWATLSAAAEGSEPGHLYSPLPYLGDGLSQTVQKLLAENPPKAPIASIWSSMNGESHWGKELGLACLRNKSSFRTDAKTFHPADCFGEVGSAFGPLMAGLAAHGIAGAYRPGPALIYCSSDRGQRAALLVSPL